MEERDKNIRQKWKTNKGNGGLNVNKEVLMVSQNTVVPSQKNPKEF